MLNLDMTAFEANKPPKHINNCVVTQLDPTGAGLTTIPRLVEIRLPGFDGAPANAMFYGNPPTLAVDEIVRCRRDSADTQVLTIEGSGSGNIGGGTSVVYSLIEPAVTFPELFWVVE